MNPQHAPYEDAALPLSYPAMVAGTGFEPVTSRLWAWRAAIALPRANNIYYIKEVFFDKGKIIIVLNHGMC